MAVITGVLLVAVLGILYVTSRPPSSVRQVVAEFRDAFPMIEGMQLRSDGAVSGSIGKIRVDDKGLAEVTLLVDKTVPPPRADATATIRQADSTGDSYIAYDPGSAGQPLPERNGKPTIACDAPKPTSPCLNTLAAPRLDDLINAFGPPEQAGVKLLLQNLSDALASRGDDVNRAALKLVPALDAANTALAEVNTQNTALKRLITDMEAVSGQAAARHAELGRLIDAADTTLHATAAATAPLDSGLRGLPAMESQLGSVLRSLNRTATATQPLASQLAAGAPALSSVLAKAPSFLGDARAAIRQGLPTLQLTRKLVVAGAPTIEADPQRVVTGSFDLAPALSNLLKGILGGDDIIKGFFGDDKNGAAESRPGFGVGLGAASSEPGNLGGFPGDWRQRNWVRFQGVLNCAVFGLPIQPGCLATALAQRAAKDAKRAKAATAKVTRAPAAARAPAAPVATPKPAGVLQNQVGDVLDSIRQALGNTGDLVPRNPSTVKDVLDYLMR
jgi:ABC-type transporter Mla subunit MlaD